MMKPKIFVTAALLLFVGVSLATIVVKEMSSEPTPVAESPSIPAAATSVEALPAEPQEKSRFVMYYFHGNLRCKTCKAIESQSHDAITTMFVDQLSEGELEWRIINYDHNENTHYRDDFEIAFQSLILAEKHGEKTVRWKNFPDVWTKIHEGPQAFEEYIVDSTVSFMTDDET